MFRILRTPIRFQNKMDVELVKLSQGFIIKTFIVSVEFSEVKTHKTSAFFEHALVILGSAGLLT